MAAFKKVLIITYYWPPAGGPGVQRWLKFTKYLPEFGVEPIVLTVDPQKATYPLRDDSLTKEVNPNVKVHYSDTFEPFGAYQKTTGRKEVPFSGFANESDKPGPRQKIAKFIRGNFFLPDARKGWNKYALKHAKRILSEQKIDAIITTGPPHSTHLIGRALKRSFGVKWVADFRDPWTDIYYYDALYPTKIARAIDAKMERSVLEEADIVVPVSRDMLRILSEKSKKIKRDKFKLLYNGFDHVDFANWPPAQNEKFTIVYAGTLTKQYRLANFFNMLDEISNAGTKIKLLLAGKQDELVQQQLAALKNVEVELLGYISHEKSLRLLNKADALLLAIPDLDGYKGIVPGKLFEYLAAQRLIFCLGPEDCDAAQLIAEAQAGVTFDYENSPKMRRDICAEIENWQRNELPNFNTEFIAKFSRRSIAGKLAALITQAD